MLEQPVYLELPKRENAPVRSISREDDLAWLAGIIDGEGCISVDVREAQNGKFYISPKVRVINTDVRMIAKVSCVYHALNVVYYYNINRKVKPHYKDQLAIIVSSQGSCLKVLEALLPDLANKQAIAGTMIALLSFVRDYPKGGNTSSYDYLSDPKYLELVNAYETERKVFIEPSTTVRRARQILTW